MPNESQGDAPAGPVGDVTTWLGQLSTGDDQEREDARRRLDERFANMLKTNIRERLNGRVGQRVGGSDIYQELMHSFFRRVEAGEYELPNRDALRALLFEMIKNKVINARLYHRREKRDVEREVPLSEESEATDHDAGEGQLGDGLQRPAESIDRAYRRNLPVTSPVDRRGDSLFADKNLIDLLTYGADQEDAAVAEEVYETVKSDLAAKPPLDTVFDFILAGFSNEEIANEIQKTVARVRQLTGDIRARMLALGVGPEFRDPLA